MVMGHIKFNDGQSVINRTNLNKTGLATYCNVMLCAFVQQLLQWKSYK